jgi:hypothetical protein
MITIILTEIKSEKPIYKKKKKILSTIIFHKHALEKHDVVLIKA